MAWEDVFKSGSLTAAEQEVRLNMPGVGSVAFQVTGTFTATITFEASVDGTNYVAVPATNLVSGAKATTATAAGIYLVHAPGVRYTRARVSAYTDGAVVVSANGTTAVLASDALGTAGAGQAVTFDANNGNVIGTLEQQQALFSVYDATINRAVAIRSANNMTDAAAGGTLLPSAQVVYGGTSFQRLRTPAVFKTVDLTAATAETTIWTPAASRKFRLMGFLLTAGAASTLTFKDNTAGTTIAVARGATDTPISVDLGNGILSAAANNVLTVTRGTSATLSGVVFGTEEA